MPDTNPADPTPVPATPTRTRGTSNQAHLNEIKDARKVAKAATDPRYLPALTEVELDPAIAPQIVTLAKDIENDIGKIKGARTGRRTMTKQEKLAREAIMVALGPIQSAAKRRFEGDQETMRANYAIGLPLSTLDFQEMATTVRGILDRLTPGPDDAPPQDTLPGIKPTPQIAALATALGDYGSKDTAQSDQQNTAANLLEKVETDIATLANLRRQIQRAADQAYPWRTRGLTTTRKAFLLPADRPLTE